MRAVVIAATLAAALAGPAAQAQSKDQKEAAKAMPVYTPPLRGAPQRRVGGSSRGIQAVVPRAVLLVPDHVGLTVSESPKLYWYLSMPAQVQVEVVLVDDKGETRLIEYSVPDAKGPAMHQVDLASQKVQLRPGVQYRWTIATLPKPGDRSRKAVSAGALERVSMPGALASRRTRITDKAELARAYAAEGIWYDAIALYSELIEQRPTDRSLREQRATLLEQVGLREVAAFDRRSE